MALTFHVFAASAEKAAAGSMSCTNVGKSVRAVRVHGRRHLHSTDHGEDSCLCHLHSTDHGEDSCLCTVGDTK